MEEAGQQTQPNIGFLFPEESAFYNWLYLKKNLKEKKKVALS